VKIWVGVTDKAWFDHLAARAPEEVNFWQPSGRTGFRAIPPGAPFLFKLHAPHHAIAGGGWFVRSTALPASLAWQAFGEGNGVPGLAGLIARVRRYARAEVGPDPVIGCNLLATPFFLPEDEWIPAPPDWAPNIVRGKTYDTGELAGRRLWEAVQARMPAPPLDDLGNGYAAERPRFGAEFLARARLGQGTFRVLVTDAYHRRCAVTGERTLPALEAAHIRAHRAAGPNRVSNGLLLRSDLHRLFDTGLVTVDPDLRFVVSGRIREDYENGREYYRYHGRRLANLPEAPGERPSREFLDWHNREVFAG